VADSRVEPKTQGLRSAGNSVEDKTLKTRQKGINILRGKKISMPPSGYPESVIRIGEAVDERWQ
jgi:hypothetical protein